MIRDHGRYYCECCDAEFIHRDDCMLHEIKCTEESNARYIERLMHPVFCENCGDEIINPGLHGSQCRNIPQDIEERIKVGRNSNDYQVAAVETNNMKKTPSCDPLDIPHASGGLCSPK
jgi:hypothetical protein